MSHSRVIIYEHADYGGSSQEITDDLASMPSDWNDRVSSIRTTTPIALFQHNNYGGDVLIINQDTPNLSNVRGRNFNDRVSSIRMRAIYIRLNIIQGDFDNKLARSYRDINQEVNAANELFGPYGIYMEVGSLRLGGTELYEPQTTLNLNRYKEPFRLNDHLNVTYFTGDLYATSSWRWRVQSLKLLRAPGYLGALHADIYAGTNYTGTEQHCLSDQATINAALVENVRSIELHGGTHITVYSETNFQGDRQTFRKDIPDTGEYGTITDWWGDKGGHTGGQAGNWQFLDIKMRPGPLDQVRLARQIAYAMGIPGSEDASNLMHFPPPSASPLLTFEQAEIAMKHLHTNSALSAFFEAKN